jgi:hypothetical protein
MKIAARASRAARMTGVLQMGWFATAGGMRSVGVGKESVGKTEDVLVLELVGDMTSVEFIVQVEYMFDSVGEY